MEMCNTMEYVCSIIIYMEREIMKKNRKESGLTLFTAVAQFATVL